MADRRLTVVIPTYNRLDEVTHTVAQLCDLPEQPGVIVVDNGSQDGTARVLPRRFPHITVMALDANLGAAARNIGIQHAPTPYVALCDDDVWWAPGSLRRAADLLAAYPRLAVLTGRVLIGPEEREDPTCRVMAESPLSPAGQLPGPAVLGFLAGAAMVRRSAVLAVGGFEPRFFLGGEEALVAADLVAAGWELTYMSDVVIHHYPSPRRDARARQWLLHRNALWFAWLRRPWPSACRRTWRVVQSALTNPQCARGVASALCGLPWALRNRRVLPERVEAALQLLEQSVGRLPA